MDAPLHGLLLKPTTATSGSPWRSGSRAERFIHRIDGEVVSVRPTLDPGDGDAAKLIEEAGGEALLDRGYIALQAESHPVEFRRVDLLPLE